MNEQYTHAAIQSRPLGAIVSGAGLAQADLPNERLPFTVRIVRDEGDLAKAIRIRQAAYARHVPTLADTLRYPEQLDYDSDTVVMLAESKLDGAPIGTARIQTNLHGPLTVEQSIEFPPEMQGLQLAEVTRLGVEEGRVGLLVKAAMLKAVFTYCDLHGMDYMVAAGRSPVDRQYEQLMFEDVFPEGGFIPLRHAGNMPHRVMAFHMASGPARWAAAKHPLYKFFFCTRHADIDISGSSLRRPVAMPAPHFATQAMAAMGGARTIA